MNNLRFAMVSTFYPPYHFGGDAVFLRRLSHALARRGHTVEVIHDLDAFTSLHRGERPAPLDEPPGVTTHPLESRLGTLACLATHQTGRPVVHGRRIRRLLETGAFDVIHFHNISLVGGPGVLAYGAGIKLYTAHEHWLVCPTHVLWRHGRELCTERQCLRCVLHHRRPPQLWRATGLLARQARHVDVFFSPSAWSAAKHRQMGFTRELEVMPYFLPDPDADDERGDDLEGDAHRDPYFLFVGRLEKIKGLQDVLPLFGGNAPADLLVVGSGTYEDELHRQAETVHAAASGPPRVRFLGRRSPAQLRQLYRDALAVIVPSVCYETFGIVLLEAFRDQTPVIARHLGPFPEVVQASGGGLLFSSTDQLAAALRRLAGDAALRARLGAAGHRALLDRWIERVVLRRYFGHIRNVAEHKQLPRVLDALGSGAARVPAAAREAWS